MASRNTAFSLVGDGLELLHLGLVGAQGLFADHVFALLQQGLAVLVMEGVGAGHVHGVNLRAGGQVLHRGEGEPGAVLFGVLLCPLPGAGVDAGQLPQAAV